MKLKKLNMSSVSGAAIDTVSLTVGAMSSGAIENVAADLLPASLKPYAKYGLAAGFITLSALMPSGSGQLERFVRHAATGAAFKQVYDIVTGELKKVLPVKDEAETMTDRAINGLVGMSGADAWQMPVSSVRSLAASVWGSDPSDEFSTSAMPSRSAVSSMA